MFLNAESFLLTQKGSKGYVRAKLLAHQLSHLNVDSIIDVGCGNGLASMEIYKTLNPIKMTLVDPLTEMLNHSRHIFSGVENIDFKQEIPMSMNDRYDLVLSHGVIGWVDNARDHIGTLKRLSKKYISLMVGNPHGHLLQAIRTNNSDVVKQLLNGEYVINSDSQAGQKVRLFNESDIRLLLQSEGIEVVNVYGVRLLTDLINEITDDTLIADEIKLGESMYADMCIMTHVIGKIHE